MTVQKNGDPGNDIMLLKLSEAVEFDTGISPVCLPQEGYEIHEGTACYTSGWGYLGYGGRLLPYIIYSPTYPWDHL